MKTAIKLTLIYFLMQLAAIFVVMPFAMLYVYRDSGSLDTDRIQQLSLAPAMLLGFLFMGGFLWKGGYLKQGKQLYALTTPDFLGWSLLAGISGIGLLFLLSPWLSFLPDWMNNTFNVLQSGWLGILCIAVLGPILEEMLFRGAITEALLRKYSPVKAIVISGLVFGIFHVNPAQVVTACFFGFLLAWVYYKSQSLIPCILIHILNNSLSVYLNIEYPEIEEVPDVLGTPATLAGLVVCSLLLFFALRKLNHFKQHTTTTEL